MSLIIDKNKLTYKHMTSIKTFYWKKYAFTRLEFVNA